MAIGTWRLLRSKEAIIIIVWYAVISLWLQGSGLAPVYLFNQAGTVGNPQYGQWTSTICIALSYPVIGLLADMWVGRHKLINFSLWLKWATVITVTLASSLVITISNTSITPNVSEIQADVLITVLTLLEQIGLTSFQVTAIQFGTDQLQGAPKDHLSSFVFWYVFVEQIATPIIEWVNYSLYFTETLNTYKWVLFGWSLLVASLLTAILSIKNCFMSNWFVREPGTPNPYRLVYHVIRFALKHKHPVQHNALTQWENRQPSRLDYGLYKYGGPFTAEEVDNVKKLLKLGAVLLSLFGVFIAAFTLQDDWQSLVMVHIGGRTPTPENSLPLLLEASCDTVVLVFLIPLHELVIYPLFQKYILSMLKRIWMGAVLIIACTVSILVIDAVGHSVSTDVECYSIQLLFNATKPYALTYSTLGINSAFILIPNFLYGLATLTFHISLIEFIVIRSPHSMKGMLLGLYYTFRYGLSECFPLSLQYVFDYHSSGHHLSCASSFYLMLTIIALLSLVCFTAVAYKIRHWDEHEEINVPSFVEEQEEEGMYQEN